MVFVFSLKELKLGALSILEHDGCLLDAVFNVAVRLTVLGVAFRNSFRLIAGLVISGQVGEDGDIMKAFLLCGGVVVAHKVLVRRENARGFHGAAELWAQEAFYLYTSFEVEAPAVVADPVRVGNLIDSVAPLMHWDVAVAAENNQVLIFVVTVVANSALGIFLHHQASLVGTKRGKSVIIVHS
jgi:hypothetical protein